MRRDTLAIVSANKEGGTENVTELRNESSDQHNRKRSKNQRKTMLSFEKSSIRLRQEIVVKNIVTSRNGLEGVLGGR